MSIKRKTAAIHVSRLENEVILAVVILYVLLSAALLAIHHMQPDEVETQTSSTSPSHGSYSIAAASTPSRREAATTTSQSVRDHMLALGFEDVCCIEQSGSGYKAAGLKAGVVWRVTLDADLKSVTTVPLRDAP